jgi:hypothetical protein
LSSSLHKLNHSNFLRQYFLLYTSLFLLVAPAFLAAQAVAEKVPQPADSTFIPDTTHTGDDIFFSIKMGIILPQGIFAHPIVNPGAITTNFNTILANSILPFKGTGALGAKPGYTLQFDGFTSIIKFKPVHFGIEYGFDFGYVPQNWTNVQWSNYNMTMGNSPFLFLGFKAGPAIYLNPAKDMGIGIYAVIHPYITAPGGENAFYNYTDASGNNTTVRYNLKDSSDFHVNIDASAGINIYYKLFIIGVEYSWIHTKYTGQVYENESVTINGITTYPAFYNPFVGMIQTDMLKIAIGIRLGYRHRGGVHAGD